MRTAFKAFMSRMYLNESIKGKPMLTRDDVPDLADFLTVYYDLTLEEAVHDFVRYNGSSKTKLKGLLKWYDETVELRDAILSQGKLLLAQPVFSWKLACSIIWPECAPDEYYQAMGFESEDEAIADTRGELLKVLQKLEETPVPEIKPR